MSLSEYKSGEFYKRSSNDSINELQDPWEFYEEVTHDLSELVQSIRISTSDPRHSSLTVTIGDDNRLVDESVGKFAEKKHYSLGRCFSFEIHPNVTKLGITSVTVVAKIGQYIYLHHPRQFMELDSRTKVHNSPQFYVCHTENIFDLQLQS